MATFSTIGKGAGRGSSKKQHRPVKASQTGSVRGLELVSKSISERCGPGAFNEAGDWHRDDPAGFCHKRAPSFAPCWELRRAGKERKKSEYDHADEILIRLEHPISNVQPPISDG